MLFVYSHAISLLEIPNEISLCLNISGCPCKCEGCSEPYLQEDTGEGLSEVLLSSLLERYKNYNLTCICFMGGDKDHGHLLSILSWLKAVQPKLKFAFYSGLEYLDLSLVPYLNYYKIGRFILPKGPTDKWHKTNCGPINFPWSNQLMFKIEDNKIINITSELRKNPISDLERYIIKEDTNEVSN